MYGEAFADVRKNILYQIHFGADYSKGTYGWSLNLDTVKRSIEKQLKELRTDYIDYGVYPLPGRVFRLGNLSKKWRV